MVAACCDEAGSLAAMVEVGSLASSVVLPATLADLTVPLAPAAGSPGTRSHGLGFFLPAALSPTRGHSAAPGSAGGQMPAALMASLAAECVRAAERCDMYAAALASADPAAVAQLLAQQGLPATLALTRPGLANAARAPSAIAAYVRARTSALDAAGAQARTTLTGRAAANRSPASSAPGCWPGSPGASGGAGWPPTSPTAAAAATLQPSDSSQLVFRYVTLLLEQELATVLGSVQAAAAVAYAGMPALPRRTAGGRVAAGAAVIAASVTVAPAAVAPAEEAHLEVEAEDSAAVVAPMPGRSFECQRRGCRFCLPRWPLRPPPLSRRRQCLSRRRPQRLPSRRPPLLQNHRQLRGRYLCPRTSRC
jgi:hypothetical protein